MPHKWTYRLPHDHLKTNVRWSKIQAKATSTLSKNTLFFSFFGTQISISSPKSPYTRHLIWIWHSRCVADHCREWFAEWAEATRQVTEKRVHLVLQTSAQLCGRVVVGGEVTHYHPSPPPTTTRPCAQSCAQSCAQDCGTRIFLEKTQPWNRTKYLVPRSYVPQLCYKRGKLWAVERKYWDRVKVINSKLCAAEREKNIVFMWKW